MAYRSACLIVAAVALLASGAPLGAQARERVAFVSVVDRATGQPKDAVTAADLVIREDKAVREILRVTPATGPMPIAVLVDTSTGAERAIPDIRAAATAFVRTLGDLGSVALVGMGARPTLISDYAPRAAAVEAGIGRIFAQPMSAATVIDAIDETAAGLARRESERAAIVVISYGGYDVSSVFHAQALERLKASGASLHVVMVNAPGRSPVDRPTRERDTLLDRGVRATGGSRHDVLASMGFTAATTAIARILTHQFRVVYARPQTLIPPESVEVTAASRQAIAYGGPARGQPK